MEEGWAQGTFSWTSGWDAGFPRNRKAMTRHYPDVLIARGHPRHKQLQLHEADTGEEGSVRGNAAGAGGSESLRASAPWGESALFSRSGSTGANGHLRLKVPLQRMDPPWFYGKETPIHQPDTTIPIESDSYSLWVLLH